HRTVTTSLLHVRPGFAPVVVLRDVVVGETTKLDQDNAGWTATAGVVELSLSVPDLLRGRIVVSNLALTDADIRIEKHSDDRDRGAAGEHDDLSSTRYDISSLKVTRGVFHYDDRSIPFSLRVQASTVDSTAQHKTHVFTTRYRFDGTYHGAS